MSDTFLCPNSCGFTKVVSVENARENCRKKEEKSKFLETFSRKTGEVFLTQEKRNTALLTVKLVPLETHRATLLQLSTSDYA